MVIDVALKKEIVGDLEDRAEKQALSNIDDEEVLIRGFYLSLKEQTGKHVLVGTPVERWTNIDFVRRIESVDAADDDGYYLLGKRHYFGEVKSYVDHSGMFRKNKWRKVFVPSLHIFAPNHGLTGLAQFKCALSYPIDKPELAEKYAKKASEIKASPFSITIYDASLVDDVKALFRDKKKENLICYFNKKLKLESPIVIGVNEDDNIASIESGKGIFYPIPEQI